jgi:hypothetical protein
MKVCAIFSFAREWLKSIQTYRLQFIHLITVADLMFFPVEMLHLNVDIIGVNYRV